MHIISVSRNSIALCTCPHFFRREKKLPPLARFQACIYELGAMMYGRHATLIMSASQPKKKCLVLQKGVGGSERM